MLLLSSNSRPSSSSMKSSPSFLIAQVLGAILLCPPDLIEQKLPMIAPFPRTIQEIKTRIEVDKLLNKCWKNPDAGYEIQPTDEWIVNNQHQSGEPFDILEQDTLDDVSVIAARGRPSTYGEITTLGARQLFGAMGLMDCPESSQKGSQENPPIHFFDLGSGTGKLVGQVILELPNSSVYKATGIELSPSRHESAVRAKEALLGSSGVSFDRDKNNYYGRIDGFDLSLSQENDNKLELLQGDLFDADLSTATHIYVASLCFPRDLMVRLEERLLTLLQYRDQQHKDSQSEEEDGGTQNCALKWVTTLQPFPNNLGGISPVVRFMEMSWTKPLGCAVYVYRCS